MTASRFSTQKQASASNHCVLPNIIDVEASGFGSCSYPIEVGVVTSCGERYCRLVRPCDDWVYWSDYAEKIHGIGRMLIEQKGLPVKAICHELNEVLSGQTVYSDAWVHDQPWLIKLFAAASVGMRFSVSAIEHIATESQLTIWDKTKQNVIDSLNLTRHRASHDAYIIQQTYLRSFCDAERG